MCEYTSKVSKIFQQMENKGEIAPEDFLLQLREENPKYVSKIIEYSGLSKEEFSYELLHGEFKKDFIDDIKGILKINNYKRKRI